MELPDSIKAIGEQVSAGGDVTPVPEWFEAHDVFSAELAHIFTRPWLAVDHASRLSEDGSFVRADVGSRSVVVVREKEGCVHALRNSCLHAGYRVCEEEAGRADQLYCQYHGWFYALDGLLTDPVLQPKMTDRSRFRLPRYAMQIRNGLIFVDLSAVAPVPPEAGPIELGGLPDDLGARTVRRKRYRTTHNWKRLRQYLWNDPGLAFGGEHDGTIEFGPLSMVVMRGDDAVLVRMIPRFPAQTDLEVVQMPASGRAGTGDPVGDALRENEERIAAAPLDRGFYDWYWPMLAPAVAA